MKIWRIEDESGVGMYSSYYSLSWGLAYPHDYRHPMPYEDSLLRENMRSSFLEEDLYDISNYIFGFTSLEQLRCWIYSDSWLKDLHYRGFILSIYEVEDEKALVGHTQVIFIRSSDVVKYSIEEYFNLN